MRLISAAFVAILVLFVSAAQSADTLDVHLVSQTTNNITLGWTPQAGYGYLFFRDCTTIDTGCSLVSRTNNANASTVTYAKGHNIYKVSVITEGNRGTYTTATPPPPPDTTAPVVSMTSPADGATVSGTINVSVNATDNIGVVRVDFYRDFAVIGTDTTTPFSITDNTTLLTNGPHGYGARAYDAAGNEGLAAPVHNTVANGAPPPVTQCSDGVDNSDPEDTLVDLADPGCTGTTDNDETDPVAGLCAKTTPNVPDGPDGMGGCFPGPASAGVPAGTTLTPYSGSCTLLSGTYDARTFNCDMTISGTVTITRSRVNGSIQVAPAGNLTISDSYVDAAPNGPRETRAIWVNEGTATIVRNELVGGNGTVWCNDCTIRDSYVHGQELQDPWHASAVRADQNSVVIHNSLWCEAPNIGNEGGCSADLTGYPDFQPTHHWTIERNLFMANPGNGWCGYFGATGGKPYSNDSQNATYIVVRDNVFQRGSTGKCGSYDVVTDFAVGKTGNVWTNNKLDNGVAVNP